MHLKAHVHVHVMLYVVTCACDMCISATHICRHTTLCSYCPPLPATSLLRRCPTTASRSHFPPVLAAKLVVAEDGSTEAESLWEEPEPEHPDHEAEDQG